MDERPQLVGIYTAPEKGAAMIGHEAITAVAGHGLEGDRKAGLGDTPGRQITLVTQEAIDALADRHGITLPPGGTRRNLVTRGVDLNDLVGRRFRVGEVELLGVKRCHPCNYLEELTEVPGLRKSLEGYGGLNADISTGGVIRVGDSVVVTDGDDATAAS